MEAFSRPKFVLLILFAYFFPLFALSFFHADGAENWMLLGVGLFFASFGSLFFFWFFQTLESVPISVPLHEEEPKLEQVPENLREMSEVSLETAEKELSEEKQRTLLLEEQLKTKSHDLERILAEQDSQKQLFYEQQIVLQKEFADQRQVLLDDMDKQRQTIMEHYQTILEQRDQLDRKAQQMAHLESKVRDLNYELKTILQLTEKTVSSPSHERVEPPLPKSKHEILRPFIDSEVQTEDEAASQLRRCLEIAQGMTGASHYGANSRFRELSAGHYALDQRRLFDRLRTEQGGTIFVYSQKDNRILFVNDQVKILLGITTEKFMQAFFEMISSGLTIWQEAIQQLAFKNEVHVQLPFKVRYGEEMLVECLLGIIPTGLFRNQMIGILLSTGLFEQHLMEKSIGAKEPKIKPLTPSFK